MIHVCDQRFDVTGNFENFCELSDKFGCNRSSVAWIVASGSCERLYSGALNLTLSRVKDAWCDVWFMLGFGVVWWRHVGVSGLV